MQLRSLAKRAFVRRALLAGAVCAAVTLTVAQADSHAINFESPAYTAGSVHGQDGWSSSGSAGSGCAMYDHEVVVNGSAPASFGAQSLRISNAVTSGCFGDQTFSKSLVDEAGETSAVSNGQSGGTRQTRFEAGFDLASVVPGAEQPGLSFVVSPDRGDGARMSHVRFADQADGIHVFFFEYRDIEPFGGAVGDANGCGDEDDFFETAITMLDRTVPHSVRIVVQFVDGPRNDVVEVYLDGALSHTGTSWEDYFRYCEGNPTRPVDSLLFRTAGAAAPATAGNGFLIDNLSLLSGPALVGPPTSKDACKKDGWKTFNNPSFKNQGDCVSFVNTGQ